MTISELQKQAYEIAQSKSWRDREDWWGRERSWDEIVCLIHSKISKAFEEWRAGRMEVWWKPIMAPNGIVTEKGKPEGFPIKLADIVIMLMDWAEHEHSYLPDWINRGSWSISKYVKDRGKLDYSIPEFIRIIHGTMHDSCYHNNKKGQCFNWVCILARSHDIDLEAAILMKMDYNRRHSYRHGGKKA